MSLEKEEKPESDFIVEIRNEFLKAFYDPFEIDLPNDIKLLEKIHELGHQNKAMTILSKRCISIGTGILSRMMDIVPKDFSDEVRYAVEMSALLFSSSSLERAEDLSMAFFKDEMFEGIELDISQNPYKREIETQTLPNGPKEGLTIYLPERFVIDCLKDPLLSLSRIVGVASDIRDFVNGKPNARGTITDRRDLAYRYHFVAGLRKLNIPLSQDLELFWNKGIYFFPKEKFLENDGTINPMFLYEAMNDIYFKGRPSLN